MFPIKSLISIHLNHILYLNVKIPCIPYGLNIKIIFKISRTDRNFTQKYSSDIVFHSFYKALFHLI